MGKIDIRLLFQKYFETLCNYQTNERSHFDIFLQLFSLWWCRLGCFSFGQIAVVTQAT